MSREEIERVERIVEQAIHGFYEGKPIDIRALSDQYPHLADELKARFASLRDVIAARETVDRNEPAPAVIAGYQLESKIGQGGFGQVFAAIRLSDQKRVALKLLNRGKLMTGIDVERVLGEAKAMRGVLHPNIVQFYEAGSDGGRFYIAMQLVEGSSLAEVNRAALGPRQIAQTMAKVAQACAALHAIKIVHRDLKPANVLIDSRSGEPLVTDFGLIKRFDATLQVTSPGNQLGTPGYMSPEQVVDSAAIDARSDIFSLGATLYFLLCGRPPFPLRDTDPPAAAAHQLQYAEPFDISRHNPDVPESLQTICLKCLEKDPTDRYQSAELLAADLERFIDGRKVHATRPGRVGRLHRWMKLHPTLAKFATASVASIALAAIVTAIFANVAREKATESKRDRTIADTAKKNEVSAASARRAQEYFADMRELAAIWERGEKNRILETLSKYENANDDELRHFEWHYWKKLCQRPSPVQFDSDGSSWNRLSFDQSGKRLAGIDSKGRMIVWNVTNSKELCRIPEGVRAGEFAPDGGYVIVLGSLSSEYMQLRSSSDGSLIASPHVGLMTTCVAVRPNGAECVTANAAGDLFLWSLPSGHFIAEVTQGYKDSLRGRSLDIQHGSVEELAFSPDGNYLASGCEDGTVQIWNLDARQIVGRGPRKHTGAVTGITFNADGSLVASQSLGDHRVEFDIDSPGEIKVWERDTGLIRSSILPHSHVPRPPDHDPRDRLLAGYRPTLFGQFRPAFSSDGRLIYSTGDRSARAFDATTRALVQEFKGHDSLVFAIALSPDGKYLATAGGDKSIRAWPTSGGYFPSTVCESRVGIRGLALSHNNDLIAAVSEFGVDTSTAGLIDPLDPSAGYKLVYGRSENRCLSIWSAGDGSQVFQSDVIHLNLELPRFDRDDQSIGCGLRRFSVTRTDTPGIIASPIASTQADDREEELLSPDGSFTLNFALWAHTPEIRNWEGVRPPIPLIGHSDTISAAVISGNSKWIATASEDKTVRIWSALDGTLQHTLRGHANMACALAFSPDCSLLASGGMDRRVILWSVPSGEQVFSLRGHRREVSGLCFSADGRRLFSSSGLIRVEDSQPGEVMVWDTQYGQECATLRSGKSDIFCGVAVSSNGKRLYASANEVGVPLGTVPPGRILMWDIEFPGGQ